MTGIGAARPGLTPRLLDLIRGKVRPADSHAPRGHEISLLPAPDVGQGQRMAQLVRQDPDKVPLDVPDP